MSRKPSPIFRHAAVAALTAIAAGSFAMPAQAQTCAEPAFTEGARIISTRIGESILTAQALQQDLNWTASIDELDRALIQRRINAYERAIVYQLRGRAFFELGQIDATIDDWTAAIETGAMRRDEAQAVWTNIGQLHITEGRYETGTDELECAAGLIEGEMSHRDLHALALANAQAERFVRGKVWLDQYWTVLPEADRTIGAYQLHLYYLMQLDLETEQIDLLSEMIDRWPTDASNWRALISLLAMTGQTQAAFDAKIGMYRHGLLTDEDSLLQLVEEHSQFEHAADGLVIPDQEIASGRISRGPSTDALRSILSLQHSYSADSADRTLAAVNETGNAQLGRLLGRALFERQNFASAESAILASLQHLDGQYEIRESIWSLLAEVRDARGDADGAAEAREHASGARLYGLLWNSCQDLLVTASLEERAAAEQGLENFEPAEIPEHCLDLTDRP